MVYVWCASRRLRSPSRVAPASRRCRRHALDQPDRARRQAQRRDLAAGSAGRRFPAARSGRRRRAHAANRGAHCLRRGALYVACARSTTTRARSSASSRGVISVHPPIGSASSSTRTSIGDRRTVRREPGRREDRSLLLQRRSKRRQLGCGVGVEVEKDAEGWRAEFRIPFSQLRFNNTDGRTGWLRDHSRGRPPRRDVILAAAVPQCQRIRVAVRRAARPENVGRAEAL